MMEGYLDILDGYINVENKIVTYKWLSKELEIHVNIAKLILEKYVIKHRESGNATPLVATVMLIGHLKTGGMRVEVVRGQNLTIAKEKYAKIISEHLYSLQKALDDLQLLANAGDGDTQYSAIECNKSGTYTDKELFARRWGVDVNFHEISAPNPEFECEKKIESIETITSDVQQPVQVAKSPNLHDKEKVNDVNDITLNRAKEKENRKLLSLKSAVNKKRGKKAAIQSPRTGLKNLFGKVGTANQKRSPPLKVKQSKFDDTNTSNDTNHDKIVNDHMKAADITEIEESNESSNLSSHSKLNNDVHDAVVNASDYWKIFISVSKDKINEKPSLTNVKKIKNNNDIRNRTNKRRRIAATKNSVNAKKRKRIITVDNISEKDVDKDNRDSLNDSSSLAELAVVYEKSTSLPHERQFDGKRKIGKAVHQTFRDGNDCTVAKKVCTYESVAENSTTKVEVINIVKKSPSFLKSSSSLVKSKSLSKQSTLMSFFKKLS